MHLAFASAAPELVPGDTNGQPDIFVRDLQSGAVLRISVGPSGLEANGGSWTPVLSAAGTVVAFRSSASNLVPGDTNAHPDVFVHDVAIQQTVRVSVTTSGEQADKGSLLPSISADGSRVAFMSYATNMGLPPGMDEVYVRDIPAGFTEQISVSTLGEGAQHFSNFPSISADGRFVAFMSMAQNLIPNPTPNQWKVFVRDRLGCSPTIATYCTSSSTSIPGCFASIVAIGTPSLSAPQSFEIVSEPVLGGTLGVACVGVAGPDDLQIGSQGGLLCVSSFQRSIGLLTGGNPGVCEGELRLTLADLVATEPALGEPSGMAWVQFWFRDPASADGFGLSNALWFQTCP
jgi:Tol biopolymer transport system component